MWIPKKKADIWIRKFILKELAEAENVKSKVTRNVTIQSLRTALNNVTNGTCIFVDGTNFTIEDYDGTTFFYKCGREFIKPSLPETYIYLLVGFDANDLYIGEYNGKQVRQLFYKYSLVPHKHDAGGQSQRRFERGRTEELKHWFKTVADNVDKYCLNRKVYLGCNSIYKNKMLKYINKSIDITYKKSISIDDNCLWELAGVSRYDICDK